MRGRYIAKGQYSSLGEGAVVNSLDAVDIGDEMLVRVQVESGREEVNEEEKQEKGRTRHEDGMSARYRHVGWLVLSHDAVSVHI